MKDKKVYDDVEDYVGWKLIYRDVFRRPVYGGLLTPLMGTGIQLLVIALGILTALYMGWYHPAEPTLLTRRATALFLLGRLVCATDMRGSINNIWTFQFSCWVLEC